MKTIEIGTDMVTFFYKNEIGDTVRQELSPSDSAYIARQIDKGEERGRVSSGDLTLHWNIEY